jgi:hypothetical protein
MDQRRGGYTQEYWLHALVVTATADSGSQVQILPDPLMKTRSLLLQEKHDARRPFCNCRITLDANNARVPS